MYTETNHDIFYSSFWGTLPTSKSGNPQMYCKTEVGLFCGLHIPLFDVIGLYKVSNIGLGTMHILGDLKNVPSNMTDWLLSW